jgi:hypothetical protein
MARAIIGGIVLSTLVTLVLVPVFYVLVERLRSASHLLVASPADRPLGDGQFGRKEDPVTIGASG